MGKKTVFYEDIKSIAKNSYFADFSGWDMPIYLSSIKEEHLEVRNNVGFFDVSHMIFFSLKGEKVNNFLDFVTTANITSKKNNTCTYSLLCNESGGVVDDIVIYKKDENNAYIVANAGHEDKILTWLFHWNKFDVSINLEKTVLFALQGPNSVDVIKKFFYKNILSLDYYSFLNLEDMIVSRTGYTGEIGFEFIIPISSDNSIKVWNILKNNVRLCGLGSRDVLRLEAGYSLYGHEIDDVLSPIEANLSWAVDFGKEFLGEESLLNIKNNITKKIVRLEIFDKKHIPRNGNKVLFEDKEVGYVTSSSYSFYLNKVILLAYIDINFLDRDKFSIKVRDKYVDVCIRKEKFYYNQNIKNKLID